MECYRIILFYHGYIFRVYFSSFLCTMVQIYCQLHVSFIIHIWSKHFDQRWWVMIFFKLYKVFLINFFEFCIYLIYGLFRQNQNLFHVVFWAHYFRKPQFCTWRNTVPKNLPKLFWVNSIIQKLYGVMKWGIHLYLLSHHWKYEKWIGIAIFIDDML